MSVKVRMATNVCSDIMERQKLQCELCDEIARKINNMQTEGLLQWMRDWRLDDSLSQLKEVSFP